MKYRFGSDPYNYDNIVDIEANTLEFAILKFAYTNRDFSKYLDKESKKNFVKCQTIMKMMK